MAVAALIVALLVAPAASAQQQTFSSATPLDVIQSAAANPYPVTIDVSGMDGTLSDANVTLSGITLTSSALDLELVSPHGEAVLLSSDVPTAVAGQGWTFDDAASIFQPVNALTGLFLPTDVDVPLDSDTLPAPAPSSYGTSLSGLNGFSPNGTWKLYARDGTSLLPVSLGTIGGLALELTTLTTTVTGITAASPSSKDYGAVTVAKSSTPQTFTVTNVGAAALSLTGGQIQGADASSFTVAAQSCLGQTLAPAVSCSFDVVFKPVSAGLKSAALFIDDNTGSGGRLVSLFGTGLDPLATVLPGTGGGTSQPGTETGSRQVDIQSATFEGSTVVGEPANLHIEARGDKQPVTGLLVDFGETLGRYAASSCVKGAKGKRGTTAFDVPYRFTQPGQHTVNVTVLAGGCSRPTSHSLTFSVAVAPARAARVARASASAPSGDITSKCASAALVPSAGRRKAILAALLCVMNEQRALVNAKPLKLSKRLGKAAARHTRAMVGGKFFAHQGPREAGFGARLSKVNYRGPAGENIGAGAGVFSTPVEMVNGWMHSRLHRANLLSKRWRTVGIGFSAEFPLPPPVQPAATYTTDFGVNG